MVLRPVQQEGAFLMMILWVVPIIFVGISVFIAWRARKQGVGGVVPRVLGIVLGGLPIAYAFGGMMISPPYSFPESFFMQGIALCVGTFFIAAGNAVAERSQRQDKEQPSELKGTYWVMVNTIAAVVSGYMLSLIGLGFSPVLWLVVGAAQWLLLRQIISISPLWVLGALFASLGYFTDLAGNLTLGYYIGGLLMVGLQWIFLKPHNPKGAAWFAGATLVGWIIFGGMFDYIPGSTSTYRYTSSGYYVPLDMLVLSYYGLVIIWSSVLVGLVAARVLRPQVEMQSLSETQTGTDK